MFGVLFLVNGLQEILMFFDVVLVVFGDGLELWGGFWQIICVLEFRGLFVFAEILNIFECSIENELRGNRVVIGIYRREEI